MAKVSSAGERVVRIKKFIGLNENPDGDVNLKMGEAVEMSNFKITDDGSLQVRGGTRNVAGLLQNGQYIISTASTSEILQTSINNTPLYSFTAYPNVSLTTGGILALYGTPVTVNYNNYSDYRSYYWQDQSGRTYKFDTCSFTHNGTHKVAGGSVNLGDEVLINTNSMALLIPFAYVMNGNFALGSSFSAYYAGGATSAVGKYWFSNGTYLITRVVLTNMQDGWGRTICEWYGKPITEVFDDTYNWKFYSVTTTTEITDTSVRGIWSGYVNKTEYLVAACADVVWALSVNDNGVWTKTVIGAFNTANRVCFFGYNDKLYMLNGSEYKVWDGTTLSYVTGYVPVIAVATPPAGDGTYFEQVNKLTGSKRQRFSPNGSAQTFQLAETNVTSINWVKLNGTTLTLTTDYTVSTTDGTVTLISTPSAGTNTLEIMWTKGVGDHSTVVSMRYAELFNGATDARVFLYGNGSNEAIYSGIDETGLPNAEYFPNLNVMTVGDSNTPITSLVRHYDQLLAFKEDSAYSVRYGSITLSDGSTTAGFYITPINKGLGNCTPGQACLVENYPRTLDGRSIYEWRGTTSGGITNDQRNAKRISQRIETTLSGFNLKNAITYFDKINHEYYLLHGDTAIVHNTENDSWYVYGDFPASCIIVYKDEVYIGTADGYIRHFSRNYLNDNGIEIAAYWESGSMDFGADYKRKYSAELWVGLKPEKDAAINVTVQTDAQSDYEGGNYKGTVSNGIISFLDLSFSKFSFGTSKNPQMQHLKIKVKRFAYYKLIFSSRPNAAATITGADFLVRYTGNVR